MTFYKLCISICKEICKTYNLGDYLDNLPIFGGIEDHNYQLYTNKNKYLLKIFHEDRTSKIKDYLKKYSIVTNSCSFVPSILPNVDGNQLSSFNFDNKTYAYLIMEYIDSFDFYSLQQIPTREETLTLSSMLKQIHSIPSTIPCIYDEYFLSHFKESYTLCFSCLTATMQSLGQSLLASYEQVDFKDFPKCFIHGDCHKGNILKDKQNRLYFIDFASCGYEYRIMDIVEILNNTLFDYRYIEKSLTLQKCFLETYPLTVKELESLTLLQKCYAFISIALKQYDFSQGKNQTEESIYWIKNNEVLLSIL